LADLLDHFGRDVEDLRLAFDEHGDLILHVQALTVGAMTAGAAAGALTFDKLFSSTDTNNSVRVRASQGLFEKCKNDRSRYALGKSRGIKDFGPCRG
jgi:hypothetical protein